MQSEVFVNSLFPIELDNQARLAAAQMRISRAKLVRMAVEDFLKKRGTQPAPTIHKKVVIPNDKN